YNHIRIAGYGNASAINFEVGSIIHLTEKMHAGFHVYNPVGGKLGKNSDEKIAAVYTTGIGYEASEKFFISTELKKEENQAVTINVALHYAFIKQFFIRGGIASGSDNSFAGVGIKWKNFRTDISATYHRLLGFTPSLLLIFCFKENKAGEE